MIKFVPPKESFSGRLLARLGRVLGLRSETVYSRTILLVALIQFIVLGLAVVLVWFAVTQQFTRADEQDLLSAAGRVRNYWQSQISDPAQLVADRASVLSGRSVSIRNNDDRNRTSGITLVRTKSGSLDAVFDLPGSQGKEKVVVAGAFSFYEAGLLASRIFVVGLALAGGLMLLVMLFVVDQTIVGRIQLLSDKVENEKKSERLPVKLDVPGDDEIAQLAGSIEELARLVQVAEREYRNVVEDQVESICRFDQEERLTFFNQRFKALCERPPEDCRPPLENLLDGSVLKVLRDGLGSLSPERPVTSFTHLINRIGAPPVWCRSTLRANFNADGRWTGGQWIAADVTSEVQAQRRLQESQAQLQVLSARLMNLQDEERRRIARDLHDSTAQALSALEMNTSLLESAAADEKTRKLAADTAAISRQVCQELRNISYLLHPPLLEEKGLAFAVRWFADGFTKRNKIPVFLDLPEDFPRFPADQETALFRIVQEALSNIYRHAGATKAWITLWQEEDGAVAMEIRDNGEGLPEGFSFNTSVGVGLAGMRERMKQLGGTLEVDSSPYGVSVKCRLSATEPEEKFSHSRVCEPERSGAGLLANGEDEVRRQMKEDEGG
jgi:signal transduction histidine kinase